MVRKYALKQMATNAVVAFSWGFKTIRIGAIDIDASRHCASIISTLLISRAENLASRKTSRLMLRNSGHRRTPKKSTMNAPVLFLFIFIQLQALAFTLPPILLHNSTNPIGYNSSLSVDDSRCFDPTPDMQYINPGDCKDALAKIFNMPDRMKEKKWSASETKESILAIWDYGTCSIDLIALNQRAEDKFSSMTVALEAALVVDDCVAQRTHLGGRRRIGPKKEFEVVVWFGHAQSRGLWLWLNSFMAAFEETSTTTTYSWSCYSFSHMGCVLHEHRRQLRGLCRISRLWRVHVLWFSLQRMFRALVFIPFH